jgi:hypothetical protein
MALISNSRYVSKSLGEYTIQICKKTNYFNALHLFKVYNDTYEKQQLLKNMTKYIKRAKFMKQVVSDFNNIANKKLLDYEFLNNLCDKNTGDKFSPVKISTDTGVNDLIELNKSVKFEYMIRETFREKGSAKTIINLDINPMSAIRLSFWLNTEFGNIILTHIKIHYRDMLIFTDETKTTVNLAIKEISKDNLEEKISNRISKEENGKREVYMKNTSHRIDILTDEYIIEVKCFSNRIKAIGQVFYYLSDYPDKKPWIHLFNIDKIDKNFEKTCKNNNIKLNYEM